MAFNPFDPAIFAVGAPCLPCCRLPPPPCACALQLPILVGTNPCAPSFDCTIQPYPNYATAAAVLADVNQVPGCYGFFYNSFGSITSSAEALAANSITLTRIASTNSEFGMYASVNVPAGAVISMALSGTFHGGMPGVDEPSLSVLVRDCHGNSLYSDFIGSTSSHTFTYTVPDAGVYIIEAFFGACFSLPCGWTDGTAVFSSTVAAFNPVIALWDDSGTTRQLEACPKLYLPILTESTGDWYASCADAAADITNLTSNCVGYAPSAFAGVYDFLATDGGTSLTLRMTLHTPDVGGLYTYGSINAVAGDIITSTGSNNGTGAKITVMVIFDDTGTAVGTFVGTAGAPAVSSALPYTGRYIIRTYNLNAGFNGTVFTCVLTSSGTMSVNPIQALWDDGLDCPARLNCGDSCP